MGKVQWDPDCPRVPCKITKNNNFTDLQISGCELHKNAFVGRALLGPVMAAIAPPDPLVVMRSRGGREGEGKDWE